MQKNDQNASGSEYTGMIYHHYGYYENTQLLL